MKNSSKLLALGLVLFLGACSLSAEDTAFLDRVKGKTAYEEATHDTKVGVFSSDGKEYPIEGAPAAAVFQKLLMLILLNTHSKGLLLLL